MSLFGLFNLIVLIRTLSKPEMGAWGLFLVITTIFEQTKVGLLKNAHIRYVSSSNEHSEKAAIASSSFLINASITLLFILLIALFSDWVSARLHTGMELATGEGIADESSPDLRQAGPVWQRVVRGAAL